MTQEAEKKVASPSPPKEAAQKIANLRAEQEVLNSIRDALEERGFAHMANGRDIGKLLDERGAYADGFADGYDKAERAVNDRLFALSEGVPPKEAAQEPFGYWIEQKGAEPALLRKPAYIPEPSDLRKITPLYAHPPKEAAQMMRTDWPLTDPLDQPKEAAQDMVMRWQPIETAPKDGTRIIGWNGSRAFTLEAREHWCEYEKLPGGGMKGVKTEWLWNEIEYDSVSPCTKVIGWMPLPAASPSAVDVPREGDSA